MSCAENMVCLSSVSYTHLLEGAKLQIIRKDGTVLEEWITDGKPHSVDKLPVNEELTLREITAPDGYETVSYTHLDVYKRQLFCLLILVAGPLTL